MDIDKILFPLKGMEGFYEEGEGKAYPVYKRGFRFLQAANSQYKN